MLKIVKLIYRHYRGAAAIILIYDLLNSSSLLSIETWLEEIKENTSNDAFLALIGNKKDVKKEGSLAGRELAQKHGLYYYETSAVWAREDENGIESIMMDFLYEIIKKQNVEVSSSL